MQDENRFSEESAADEAVQPVADDAQAVDKTEDTETTAAATDQAETPEAPEPEQGEDDEPKRRNRKTARDRIAELTRQRREAEDRARKAEEALKASKRPERHEYDTEEAYEEARDDYLYARRRAREEQDRAKEVEQTISHEVVEDFRSNVAAFKAEAPDFDEVVYDPRAPFSKELVSMIMEMGEDGPRVAYALGKDHDLARDLSGMTPHRAAMELGRLAASQRRPQRRLQSKAPPPVAPVTSASGPTNPDPSKMSYAEYVRFRDKQRGFS